MQLQQRTTDSRAHSPDMHSVQGSKNPDLASRVSMKEKLYGTYEDLLQLMALIETNNLPI
jgi:hypothetical protein